MLTMCNICVLYSAILKALGTPHTLWQCMMLTMCNICVLHSANIKNTRHTSHVMAVHDA